MAEKWLVTVEFRYLDSLEKSDYTNKRKTITIGVFDDYKIACEKGNEVLEKSFESRFKLNPNYNRKERFSENGGCFGGKNTLITELTYLQTTFSFFAKITRLDFDNIDTSIEEVLEAKKRYILYKNNT